MITSVVQRWRARRGTYRPAGEPIATRLYEVARMPGENEPKAFVLAHHYEAQYVAQRFAFGLYRGAALVGVAVFSHPVNTACFKGLPGEGLERCELGRLVLLDDVPANGESWFVARCFEVLHQEGLVGVVSFSDPMARTDDAGATVFHGHIGNVYQASNAVYTGRSRAEWRWLLPDGHFIHNRTLAKIRKGERGAGSAIERLVSFGAEPVRGDAAGWLKAQLPRIARRFRHEGNHRYLFGLDARARRVVRALPEATAYPKFEAEPMRRRA